MATKKPAKKAPAKAGASIKEKREQAFARRAALERFKVQNGAGHNALQNFVYDYDTFGMWEGADPADIDRLFEHLDHLAAAIHGYLSHEFRTLDEAFKVRRPDGYRKPAARKRHLHMQDLQWEARHLRLCGAVVDAAFFEYLAENHRVDKTTATEWYYLEHRGLKPDPSRDSAGIPERIRSRLNWKK